MPVRQAPAGNTLSETFLGALTLEAGQETILLVEDDDAVRSVAQRALTRFGYNVLAAVDAEEAILLSHGHEGEIDLLITDIMMPGMNGVELAGHITRSRPGIHVFFMSGYADQDLVNHGLLEPGSQFLQKPFTPAEFAARVRGVLDIPRSNRIRSEPGASSAD